MHFKNEQTYCAGMPKVSRCRNFLPSEIGQPHISWVTQKKCMIVFVEVLMKGFESLKTSVTVVSSKKKKKSE